jgi:hypothetical protein
MACLLGSAGQPCPGPLEEYGHQSLAPGIEADHPTGHAAVSVLLPVHRRGGVAEEVGAGELAECRVEAGQFVGRGWHVPAGQVGAKGPPEMGVATQASRFRLGVEQVRHPQGLWLVTAHNGSFTQPPPR